MAETKLLSLKDRQTLTMAGARLVVLRGPDKGRAARLEDEETVVGTGPSADLKLTDDTVSRSHLAVRVTADGYLVSDLGSTNGTRLDGRRVRQAFLALGDKITLGQTTLRLEALRQAVDLPLSGAESFGRLLGASVAARRLFALLEKVAPETATVLLSGETGTGKDLAADAIHEASPRRAGPFVVVDCGALVGNLLESELFGHEKGAFTGADKKRSGAFVEAAGGTLFLDEIGELPRELQPKLLRALERKEVRPVGANRALTVDVRIIAATNRDLKLDVNRGLFREDLFYRLNVVALRLPPLRERPGDIALLATHFWRLISGDETARVPPALLAAWERHDWPGNARELRNRVERALVVDGEAQPLTRPRAQPTFRQAKAQANDAFERAFLSELLARVGGNLSEAARLAAMDRVHLSRLARRHQLRR